jgi:hypothetical protein
MTVRLPIALNAMSESWLNQQHRQHDRRRQSDGAASSAWPFYRLGLFDDRMALILVRHLLFLAKAKVAELSAGIPSSDHDSTAGQ